MLEEDSEKVDSPRIGDVISFRYELTPAGINNLNFIPEETEDSADDLLEESTGDNYTRSAF